METHEERADRLEASSLGHAAEIMALREFISVRLAPTLNLSPEEVFDEIGLRQRKAHAKLLTLLEDNDPALAARLDRRREHREE